MQNPKQDILLKRKIRSKTGKAIAEFNLIEDGDRVLLGVSGGKDSMSLLHILANLSKYGRTKFQIEAVLIQIKNLPFQINIQYLEDTCKTLDVPFRIHTISIPNNDERGKNICFLCSQHRRKALFEMTEVLQCNKLALGHNMDDAIETLIMNMAFQGAICSTPAKLELFNGKITIIRPLINLTNQELIDYAKLLSIPDEIKNCPHERESSRALAAHLIEQLEEKNVAVRQNLFNSMANIQDGYLPKIK
jgi:tRNA(Ile)-lysidine synthetase-like protein